MQLLAVPRSAKMHKLISHIYNLIKPFLPDSETEDKLNGRGAGVRKSLPARGAGADDSSAASSVPQSTVIPNQSNQLGTGPEPTAPSTTGLLGDIFGASAAPASHVPPKQCWLPADKGKDTILHVPAGALCVGALQARAAAEAPLAFTTTGPVQRMDPLNNLQVPFYMDPLNNMQVAIKNNVDVFYFACLIPAHVLFTEDGQLDKRVFLTTWKEIPAANEVQHTLANVGGNADAIAHKMTLNNIFTIAKRNVEGQDMLYQSLKLSNNIWVLLELKLQPGNPEATLSLKSRTVEVAQCIFQAYESILKS
ncbi:Beta adaptin [Operophtera brumata]|uniref:Beta adaptin n=1 Tax=Operophtera brumata TaxID=104452 RepID=A0A0L7KQX3_OPEBR|nr:Beta adaptin [Operophtera brumata]